MGHNSISSRRAVICSLAAVGVALPASGCGYLLYPERRGNMHRAQLDPSIVVLDSILLLFFVVPGLIAFAIDLSSGCLYEAPVETSGAVTLRRRRLRGRRRRDIEAAIADKVAGSEPHVYVIDPAQAPTELSAETLVRLKELPVSAPAMLSLEEIDYVEDAAGEVRTLRVRASRAG